MYIKPIKLNSNPNLIPRLTITRMSLNIIIPRSKNFRAKNFYHINAPDLNLSRSKESIKKEPKNLLFLSEIRIFKTDINQLVNGVHKQNQIIHKFLNV